MTLTVGSLCTGYAGAELALERIYGAIDLRWVCDPAPEAVALLAHHYPDVPNHGDLKTYDWERAERVDIITAGYPCQPFSLAGQRLGIDDPRHLWPWIRDAVRVLRPRLVLLENVDAHLRLGFDRVLADLAEVGFDAEWTLVRASDVGACHKRARLWIAASFTENDGHERSWHPRDRRHGLTNSGVSAPNAHANGSVRAVQEQAGPIERRGTTNDHLAAAWGPYEPAIRRWGGVLGRPAPAPVDERRRLNPAFVEWMMGCPEGWITDVPDLTRSAQLRLAGNGIVPLCGAVGWSTVIDRIAA